MKKILTMVAMLGVAGMAYGQGYVNFANQSSTLISAGGTAMPALATSQFIFGFFAAPSTTVPTPLPGPGGQPVNPLDNRFDTVGGYNTNTTAAGRIATRNGVNVGGSGGGTVDFIIRGWSGTAGGTYAEALANFNAIVNGIGTPSAGVIQAGGMYFGQSNIGNDLLLGDGGAIGATTVFGVGPNQAQGFNMVFYPVPEPSSMALAGLGAAALLIFRRRK